MDTIEGQLKLSEARTEIAIFVVKILLVIFLVLVVWKLYERGGIPILHGIDIPSWVNAERKTVRVQSTTTEIDETGPVESYVPYSDKPSWAQV